MESPMYESASEEQQMLNRVVRQLVTALPAAAHLDLQLPQGLLHRVARDVVRLSRDEPCGLRGCVLLPTIQQKNASHSLGRVTFDALVIPTFELHLTLYEDKKLWLAPLKNLLRPLLNKQATACHVVVSPVFQLVKRKLYRSEPHRTTNNAC